jgi:hypothetical protein
MTKLRGFLDDVGGFAAVGADSAGTEVTDAKVSKNRSFRGW